MADISKVRPTAAEVARRAGVSRTAVSFVLNNVTDQGISNATRERVLQVAREMGYEPNAAAKMLASGTTGTVALVIPKASHLYVDVFLAQIVASINEECHRHGLKLLIESTDDEGREPGTFVNLVKSRSIDGLIVVNLRTTEHDHLRKIHEAGIPLVVFGPKLAQLENVQAMGYDTAGCARVATEHLIALGHERIAYVSFAPREYHAVGEREMGWRAALEAHGLYADPAWAEYANIDARSGYLATQRLLERKVKFTAMFAGNDTIAFGAIAALTEAGLRVPHDVALVGYDDIPLAEFASPPLTTIQSNPVEHGREAMEMLLAQMERREYTPGQYLKGVSKLIIRESCGARLHNAVRSK
jgi:LacI family transcriptional regulator